jgi:hypothetical protein
VSVTNEAMSSLTTKSVVAGLLASGCFLASLRLLGLLLARPDGRRRETFKKKNGIEKDAVFAVNVLQTTTTLF